MDLPDLTLSYTSQEKSSGTSQNSPEVKGCDENSNKNIQPAKEERIRELNQQVDSLQNVILQVSILLTEDV